MNVSSKLSIYVVSWLSLVSTIYAVLTLEIFDTTPLEQRTQQAIPFALHFDSVFLSAEEVNNSKLCTLVDGDVCYCFDSYFRDIEFSLTPPCLARISQSCSASDPECDYWIAIQLTFPAKQRENGFQLHSNFTRRIVSSALHITSRIQTNDRITLILPLTLDDLSRAAVLFHTLQYIPADTVQELLIFTPDSQHLLISSAVQGIVSNMRIHFTTKIYPESVLFTGGQQTVANAYPYAVQMAVKLLAARLVHTPFYITLDADIVLLRPFSLQHLLSRDSKRAVYHFEERAVHEHWWRGSELILNVSAATSYAYSSWQESAQCVVNGHGCRQTGQDQNTVQGFGVTPAILSTHGSLLTIAYIFRQLADSSPAHSVPAVDAHLGVFERGERQWLQGFGRPYDGDPTGRDITLWSEYTLYRVVLDHLEVSLSLRCDR